MLSTKLYSFRSKAKPGITIIRAVSPYSLPASVARVVSLVSELLRFPSVRHLPSSSRPPASNTTSIDDDERDDPFNACGPACAGFTTPTVLAQRYGFDDADAQVGEVAPGNSMSVAEVRLPLLFWIEGGDDDKAEDDDVRG